MNASVVKRGKGRYAVVVEEGMHTSLLCGDCGARKWAAEMRGTTCPACGSGQLQRTMRRRQRWISGFTTRREAEDARVEILGRHRAGTYVAPSVLTLRAFVEDQWLPAMASQVRASTLDSYRRNLERHVLRCLGDVALQQLSPTHLNGFYAEMLACGRGPGKGLSPKTVRYLHTTIGKALADAQRWDLVARNVATQANPPRVGASRTPRMKIWTLKELARFLADRRNADDCLYAAWAVAASTGMRRGEVLGLRWDDVDLERGQLSVCQTLVSVAYELSFSEPKTARGRRTIVLDRATVAALRRHRAHQSAERLAAGAEWVDHGLAFATEAGEPIHPDGFSQSFERHQARLGLPRIRLHDLRHTHAAHLIAAGVHVKVISERLGHASVAFTMDQYGHLLPGLQADAAEELGRRLFGEESSGM